MCDYKGDANGVFKVITASDCRRQAVLYEREAMAEEHTSTRTALLTLSQSCRALADQIDRVAELRDAQTPREAPDSTWNVGALRAG
jgi:hypothetical protein